MITVNDIKRLGVPHLLSVGIAGKISKYKIEEISTMKDYTFFLLEGRGLVVFKKNTNTSRCGNFYTDVRAITVNSPRIGYLENRIDYLKQELENNINELFDLKAELNKSEIVPEYEQLDGLKKLYYIKQKQNA